MKSTMSPPFEISSDVRILTGVAALGAGIGIGQVLASGEPLTLKLVIGRALVTSGFALGGLTVLALIPGLAPVAQVGIACAIASLGTSGIEKLLGPIFNRTPPA